MKIDAGDVRVCIGLTACVVGLALIYVPAALIFFGGFIIANIYIGRRK